MPVLLAAAPRMLLGAASRVSVRIWTTPVVRTGACVRPGGALRAGLTAAGSVALTMGGCQVSHAGAAPEKESVPGEAAPLRGQKAVVFGGTSGIGLATAIRLREAGAQVVAVSRQPAGKIGQDGVDLSGITLSTCDVLDKAALSDLLASEAPFEILVSAATGGTRAMGPFLEMDMDGYRASFDKLWGYANVVQLGAPHLCDDTGCIVLVSGCPARRPRPGQVALSSVGAAVEQLARCVAVELAPRGIRINVVSPGIIETPMFGPAGDERSKRLGDVTAANLIPRPGSADEVAHAIMFAVQNRFITGTTIDVDGGWLHKL
uniref:Uncharacterized protein n=1 Tax=Pyrodinium bahamense TaxID=73915 RepID=A0A7S0BCK6_9DINO|eukprot:CAMPEP_0179073530 /NCGR_PEP_ID=MMETSP0796-20121207/32617_1 /TAXON_ID=73915 /ORGANISM="Pyrodinium bahamense, Strain pbaha01" /LENGTH=318 /DNA_ID=CAMNT_0020770723 /DNA_START=62 /DNA_END=1018 /DNA_ORIENTATION=-